MERKIPKVGQLIGLAMLAAVVGGAITLSYHMVEDWRVVAKVWGQSFGVMAWILGACYLIVRNR